LYHPAKNIEQYFKDKSVQKMHFELRLAGSSLGPKSKSSFLAQNAFFFENNLCIILPRILNSISKERSQDPI